MDRLDDFSKSRLLAKSEYDRFVINYSEASLFGYVISWTAMPNILEIHMKTYRVVNIMKRTGVFLV